MMEYSGGFQDHCRDQLGYLPLKKMEITGVEPVTHACKARILPTKLYPLLFLN